MCFCFEVCSLFDIDLFFQSAALEFSLFAVWLCQGRHLLFLCSRESSSAHVWYRAELLMRLVLEPPEILKAADSSQWAFNSTTGERVLLPVGGDWVLLQDSPTEASYFVDASSEDTRSIWAPDIFQHKLYLSESGSFFVHDTKKQAFTRMQEFALHHRPLDVFVQVVGASQPSRHGLWFFKMADGGCNFSWSLFHLGQATAVPFMKGRFKGCRWKFVQNRFSAWKQMAVNMMLPPPKMSSCLARKGSSTGAVAEQESKRLLKHPTACTTLVIAILAKMTAAPANKGGCEDNRARGAAKTLLSSLVDSLPVESLWCWFIDLQCTKAKLHAPLWHCAAAASGGQEDANLQ